MKGSSCFVKVPMEMFPASAERFSAAVITAGGQEHIIAQLERMYSRQHYQVALLGCPSGNPAPALEMCRRARIPAIVLCESLPPDLSGLLQEEHSSAAVVSPGSYGDLSPEHPQDVISVLLDSDRVTDAAFLGWQGYYFSPDKSEAIRKRYFEEMRLGAIRDDMTQCEPLLRDKRHIFLDMESVRHSDYPLDNRNNPNGLYAEEICQIARYAGLGLQLQDLFLFHLPSPETDVLTCNRLVAEVLWHICEGIAANIREDPADALRQERFVKRIVNLGESGDELIFSNSSATGRWWMEIPEGKDLPAIQLPCSENDYRIACRGEIPTRWLFFYQKNTIL